jgi:hypothetical protein
VQEVSGVAGEQLAARRTAEPTTTISYFAPARVSRTGALWSQREGGADGEDDEIRQRSVRSRAAGRGTAKDASSLTDCGLPEGEILVCFVGSQIETR